MAQSPNMEAEAEVDRDLLGSGAEPGSHERTARLKEAVRAAGGNTAVAHRVGMPVGTLNTYLRGRGMRFEAAIALAEATGVRLEWLATGAPPMRPGAPAAPPAPPPEKPFRLFGKVQIDRLVDAYEGALASTRGLDRRLTMHLTVVLHDAIADAAEAAENQGSPQDATRVESDSTS